MKADLSGISAENWFCRQCGQKLSPMKADITYMSTRFEVELPGCPDCGLVFIPPDLAMGKMLEVEKLLEDK